MSNQADFETYFVTFMLLKAGIITQRGTTWVLNRELATVPANTTFNSTADLVQRLKVGVRSQYDLDGGVLKVA